MRFVIGLCAFIFIVLTCNGQTNENILLRQLSIEKNDDKRAGLYDELSSYYLFQNPDSATYFAELGLKEFLSKKSLRHQAHMYILLATVDIDQGSIAQAQQRFEQALQLAMVARDLPGIAKAHNGLGILALRNGRYAEATPHFYIALTSYQQAGDTVGVVKTLLKIGVLNEENGNLDKALDMYNSGLALASGMPLFSEVLLLCNSIGNVYYRKGNMDKAKEYYTRAFSKSDRPEFAGSRILGMISLGAMLAESNDAGSINYFQQALDLARKNHLMEFEAVALTNMALVEPDHGRAIALLNEALSLAEKMKRRHLVADIYSSMADVYKKAGDYKNAMVVMERNKQLTDSLFSIEKTVEIANFGVMSELKQSKESYKELAALNGRIRSQNNSIIVFSVVLMLLLATLVVNYLKTAKINQQLFKQTETLAETNIVKDKLFSIIGHDLKGTIGTIPPMLHLYHRESLSAEEKNYIFDSLYEHVNASKDTLEKLLLWGQSQIKGIHITPGFIKVKSDSMLSIITLLKNTASEKGITITDSIGDDVVVFADQAHFEFVIRNLLSNAIKFSHRNSEVIIEARPDVQDDHVVFVVKDSGVGMSPERLQSIFELTGESIPGTDNEKGTSIGLMLCKEFTLKNNGRIWAESKLGEGTTFFFSLPAAYLPVKEPRVTA